MLSNLSFVEVLEVRDLAERAHETRKKHGCTLDELKSGRKRHQVAARREFAAWLADELGWSQPAIAHLFGCDPSTICSLLARRERKGAAA